ncbi:13860_t:CDS:2 [Dentiscutata heterogama]|uniref:13860_t:CDS:1 n=1 Tax=Dentiscutata heterogama TaxID=1316150 RepID=A0ACA9KBZ6_9GLOM|nr:13860_t:CDS:2 [Dentiscutata heterogama]
MSTTSETHEIDLNLDIIKNILGVIGAIGDAAQPYLPLISTREIDAIALKSDLEEISKSNRNRAKRFKRPSDWNSTDTQGNKESPLIKKLLNGAIEVACKCTKIIDDDTSGIMVFEWAELGTLQELYDENDIACFRMILWELAFEKIPYTTMEINKIKEHVLKGNREKISWGVGPPDIQKIK